MGPRTLLLMTLPLLGLLGCEEPLRPGVRSEFRNPSTFVVVAVAKPQPDETDRLRRRHTARAAALLLAQNEVKERLKGRIILDQEVSELRYDRDDTCLLVYTVRLRTD